MAGSTSDLFVKLQGSLAHTKAKLYQPDASNYKQVEHCFIDTPVQTLGVVKPQDADEVALVVRSCLENHVEFSVRSGGHDCAARTLINGALVIDMRDINYVVVSDDKQSARVGGGILIGQLAKVLGEDGLATPV
jgi:FAD/FMN-containing dehydrogenase